MQFLVTSIIVLAALALSVGVGGPITAGMLRLISRSEARPERPERPQGLPHPGPEDSHTERARGHPGAAEVLRGGLWIGLLERFAVSGCILLGYPAGIAVVVAIKGLGRFSTLQGAPAAGVSERFLVGTLASYLWASLVALAALGVLQTIP